MRLGLHAGDGNAYVLNPEFLRGPIGQVIDAVVGVLYGVACAGIDAACGFDEHALADILTHRKRGIADAPGDTLRRRRFRRARRRGAGRGLIRGAFGWFRAALHFAQERGARGLLIEA